MNDLLSCTFVNIVLGLDVRMRGSNSIINFVYYYVCVAAQVFVMYILVCVERRRTYKRDCAILCNFYRRIIFQVKN